MPDIIKLLPEHVASQIAAGEVIQRPASMVKELIDNAVDAGSTEIKIYIKDAGKALVQVVDNGSGMSASDARLCWERHATSKIALTEDIYKINTMGFRGEALASIASVARVELKTKRAEDELGVYILIEGSEVKTQESVASPVGTSISVKNLFYNIPARRNFLKSNPVEWKHIVEEFTRGALSNPEIAFQLWHNDELQFDFKSGSFLNRVLAVFDDRAASDFLEVNEQTSIIDVTGFIGKPEVAKKMRGEQYFFVNRRFFRDPYLNHAVQNAFEGMLSKEQFPFYVLNIEINPSQIDINIHPTKTEVKFEDEKNVYQIIRAVVRKALGEYVQTPADPNFDDNRFMNLQFTDLQKHASFTENGKEGTVGNSGSELGNFKELYQQQRKQSTQNWESLFNPVIGNKPEAPAEKQALLNNDLVPENRTFFQLNNQFVVTPIKSGLMLINQQAAHERILYERYLQALVQTPIASQQLLFPKAVNLPPGDEAILLEILPEMGALGFTINSFGKNAYVINGLPAELHLENEQNLVAAIIETYKATKLTESNKNKVVAKTLAKKAAIKSGTRLRYEEMNSLVDELFACSEPQFAPDGKACIKTLSLTEIARMF
ncbi:MAG: DNA mismatch repair endonuclease MutL [Bacteroidota bacterium]|nr:DNA mismatch repair endonuclease MutL [Bacteroidota bacterium]